MTDTTDVQLVQRDLALNEASQQCTLEGVKHSYVVDAFMSLEAVAETLSGLVSENRPMPEAWAVSAQHTVTAVSGGALRDDLISMESYLDPMAKTKMSLENLTDTLKDIWEKIKLAVKNALRAMSDFFDKYLQGVGMIERKLEELKRKNAAQQKRTAEARGEISGDWPRLEVRQPERLMIRGKVDLRTIIDGARLVQKELLDASTNYYGLIGQFYDQVDRVVTSGEPLSAQAFADYVAKSGDIVKDADRMNRTVFSRTIYPGDKLVKIEIKEKEELSLIGNIKIITDPKARDLGQTFISTPNGEWVDELLDIAGDITKRLSDTRTQAAKTLMERREELLKRMDRIYSDLGVDSPSSDGKRFRRYIETVNTDYLRAGSVVDKYLYSYLRALVDTVVGILKLKNVAMSKKGVA